MTKYYLLLESGSGLLLEDSSGLLLESSWGYQPLKITIDGVDRTSSIPVESIRIVDALGKQINTASFSLTNGGAMGLAELQEVIISSPSGATRYFAGYIHSLAGHSRGPMLDYEVECVDYSWDLNHAETLVNGTYEGKSDQWIIQNAVAACIPDIDCTTYVEEIKADTVSREYVQQQPWAVLDDLAELAGAEWYVDYDKKLHYFDSGTNTAPFSLSDAYDLSASFPYADLVETVEAPTANRVIVVGAGTVTATRTLGAEGDYGRWLTTVLKDKNITTTAQAEERGDALLLAAAAAPSYTLTTRQPGLRSGQDVTLVNAARGIDAAFEIKNVTTKFLGGGYASFSVEMGKYVSGLSDLFRGMAALVDTAPATPTTPSHSTATVTDDRGNQTGSLRLDWADNAELDLSGYQVEALLTGETRWSTQRVTASEGVFEGFPLGSTVKARVKAIDLGGNESAYLDFNSGSAITMPTDTTAPALTTNPPTVTAVKKGVRISFTRPTEQDWAYTEFYCDTANPPTTLVHSGKASVFTYNVASYSLHYARVRHVDEAGNASAYSSVSSATPETVDTVDITNLAVTEGKIGNLAVTTGKIDNLAVTNAKIDSLAASKITAGTITATISIQSAGTIGFVDGPQLSGTAGKLAINDAVNVDGHVEANSLGAGAGGLYVGATQIVNIGLALKSVIIDGDTVTSDGVLVSSLNADMLEGYHASITFAANTIVVRAAAGGITVGTIVPQDTSTYDLGSVAKNWANIYVDTVVEGDHVFIEKDCAICGKPFRKGQSLSYYVIDVGGEGTRAIPAHIECKRKKTTQT